MILDRYPSPLRYPGGKGKVANYIKLIFLENELIGHEYVEPYAGGASVALSLLYEDYSPHIHINDINLGVYCFWFSVLNRTDELCAKIDETPVTVEEWHRQRTIYATATDYNESETLSLGFATFFLNRTNRSGIISNGGVIGGQGQRGRWKIDARFNKPELIRRIRKVARFRSRITLTRIDALDLLNQISASRESQKFVYLDPPYYVKGQGLYDNFYCHVDHEHIAQATQKLRCPWLASYDAAPEILTLYSSVKSTRYSLGYSARQTYQGSEVMFFSPKVAPPHSDTVAGVTAKEVEIARRESMVLF